MSIHNSREIKLMQKAENSGSWREEDWYMHGSFLSKNATFVLCCQLSGLVGTRPIGCDFCDFREGVLKVISH